LVLVSGLFKLGPLSPQSGNLKAKIKSAAADAAAGGGGSGGGGGGDVSSISSDQSFKAQRIHKHNKDSTTPSF